MVSDLPDQSSFPHERYEPLARLGTGSMGSVLKCRDRLLKRTVSIKTLKHLSESQVIDFQREARALSSLQHQGIVSVLDFGVSKNGSPFLVMEYLDGETLEARLFREGPLATTTALDIFIQIAEALEHAHTKGIYHRDITPTNIILRDSGRGRASGSAEPANRPRVKLIDFGIAAVANAQACAPITAQGQTIVGTPLYMSPDQVGGEEYGAPSEIYSLCCVLFESLAGMPPFNGTTPLELFSLHANEPAPSLMDFSTPSVIFPHLDEVVRVRGLAKRGEDRYETMHEFKLALAALVDEAQRYESDNTAYGATHEWRSSDPTREKELRAINVRYAIVFIACIVAVVSVIPLMSFAIFRQAETSKVDEQTTRRSSARKRLDAVPIEALVNVLDEDGINVRDEVLNISGSLEPELLESRTRGHRIKTVSALGVQIDPESARIFTGMKLKRIEMLDCQVSDEVFAILSQVKTLRALQIRYGVVSDAAMKSIASLPLLEDVDLGSSGVTNEGIQILGGCPTLEKLSVKQCKQITSAAFKNGFENLLVLKISGSGVETDDLGFLKNMRVLREIEALALDFTDDQISQLENLPLQVLRVSSRLLTDAGLKHFLALPKLHALEIVTDGGVTRKGINELRRARPELKIQYRKR